jgi:hypothetical protein
MGKLSGMIRYASVKAAGVCALALLLVAGVTPTALGQGVQTVLHARARVFPDVGRDAAVIERDAAGRYYVLAAPASIIWIYSADGKRIGQIPNAQAGSAAIKYAVDFDRDAASGRVFVADRGANAVKIFTAEGALEASVPVNAPMSVVALAGGEFAVVTLRSDHLVRVMNETGKVVRSFGNVADAVSDPKQLTMPTLSASAAESAGYAAGYSSAAPTPFAMDIGKLYSGAPGDIYFAFTSVKDPKFRKYDRFGYAGYEADVSAKELIPDINHDNSQVQLGMRVSGMAGPGEVFSFGSMYSVGGSAGFSASTGRGAGGRRGGAAPSSGGASGSGTGTGSGSDSVAGATGAPDPSSLNGSLSANNGGDAATDAGNIPEFTALLGDSGANGIFNMPGLFGSGSAPGQGFGGLGGFGGFGGPGGGFEHHVDAPGVGGAPGATGAAGPPAAAPAAGGLAGGHAGGASGGGGGSGPQTPGAGHGEYGERYGHGFQREGLNSFSGVVKFTEPEPKTTVTPVIHALGVDHVNQHVWAAIGDMLLHFDRDGDLMDTYRVATNEGASLQPVGILVEPDRILLLSDPAGIYEFARPDKAQLPAKQAAKPQPASP